VTHSNTWKNLEKKVAGALGGERQFNTGTHNKEDVVHDLFVVECKLRAKLGFKSWYEQAKKHVKKGSGKIALLVCKQKGQKGEFVILKLEDFVALMDREGVEYKCTKS
jgi:hypothetical protein